MCGFRPTGRLHLGHYFSVIKPGQQGCTVLVANYHAPEEKNIDNNVSILRKFGVQNIIFQNDVFDASFFFRLLTLCSVPELRRMPQFVQAFLTQKPQDQTAQLLTYPVLMAHDIEGYNEVYVGIDQASHIVLARKLLKRYYLNEGIETVCPTPVYTNTQINDLRKSNRKMSKTFEEGCLFLDDTSDDIRKKIRKAVMDPMGTKNLKVLFDEFVGGEMPSSNAEAKDKLAEKLIEVLK